MFDPRTLPNGDLGPALGLFVSFGGWLADTFISLIGIWYHGFTEKNRFMVRWLKKPWLVWVHCAGLVVLLYGLYSLLVWGGLYNDSHAWVAFTFGAPSWYYFVKNYLFIRKGK